LWKKGHKSSDGKKMQTKASVPTIGNQLQQQMNQLMLQQLQVLNITVVSEIKTITLKTDSQALFQIYID
jgi:hypothetical protein